MDMNVEYYNVNAESFFQATVYADMSLWRNKFESYLKANGRILDVGCGSGRDSKAFLEHGFSVEAFDASAEMCTKASKFIGEEVKQMRFDEIAFYKEFDGIWACASLLHVAREELPVILNKLYKSLKDNGKIYVSFKYGEGKKQRGDRIFTDLTEESLKKLLLLSDFEVIESGITTDVRPGREDEKWINAIAGKITR